ncbi:MAG: hypothetical protein P8J50_09295 [Acidimicrobiales bacterium]|jgi:hypothetical protein|nr:hypothetical protein [Acidimicrobiales bacterium]
MAGLFSRVEEYAALGIHRTGTPTQAATAEWLADRLAERGGAVEMQPVSFERYVAEWSVSIDGNEVEALPLFYEAVGAASSDDPARWAAFDPPGAGPMGTTGALDEAEPGTLAVAATRNLSGFLSVSNRTPSLGSGQHVLQVAGHHGAALAGGASLVASIDARLEPATCPNVIARFGDVGSSDELTIVTTPISGWFQCAGERGTGVAVALQLAEQLAAQTPVLFLGATGHELGAFGGVEFHSTYASRTRALIHVGANVGCDWEATSDREAPNHSYMSARLASDSPDDGVIAAAFAAIGGALDEPGRDRSKWFGEAAEWLDVPVVLSYLGQNPWFHAPQDLPTVSCTAERTEAVADAFTNAALALLRR